MCGLYWVFESVYSRLSPNLYEHASEVRIAVVLGAVDSVHQPHLAVVCAVVVGSHGDDRHDSMVMIQSS